MPIRRLNFHRFPLRPVRSIRLQLGAVDDHLPTMLVQARARLEAAARIPADDDPDDFQLRSAANDVFLAARAFSDKALALWLGAERAQRASPSGRSAALRWLEGQMGLPRKTLTRPYGRAAGTLHLRFAYNHDGLRDDVVDDAREILDALDAVAVQVERYTARLPS